MAGESGALLISGLISPEIADSFLRLLWDDIVNSRVVGQTHRDGALFKNALEIHGRNYPPLLGLHWGLTSAVMDRTGSDLLPSFSFFRLYFAGDVLRVHSDRSACELSLSLTLAYSDDQPWPLGIASYPAGDRNSLADAFDDEPSESFVMRPGDAVLYRGSVYRHGRPTPNPNRWSAHLFLQWVERGGAHENEAFERLELGARPDIDYN